jgi:hypothetical protein
MCICGGQIRQKIQNFVGLGLIIITFSAVADIAKKLNHTFHQKPNPFREKIPLKVYYR